MKPTSTATKPTERPARLFHRANHLLFLLSALLLPRRTAVAPIITLAGYLLMTIGILWRGKPTARCR